MIHNVLAPFVAEDIPVKLLGPDLATILKSIEPCKTFEEHIAENVRTCPTTGKQVSLAYHTFGEKGNPVIVLVSGLWAQCVSRDTACCIWLANQGFYVVRFDNRDCGFSTYFNDVPQHLNYVTLHLPKWMVPFEKIPYGLEEFADDAVALLQHLGLESAHWVGTSMGGMVVQLVGLRHPEVCKSLTMMMSHTSNTRLIALSWEVKLHLLGSPASNTYEAYDEFMVPQTVFFNGGVPLDDWSMLRFAWKESFTRCTNRSGNMRQLGCLARAPPRDEALKKLRVPTLILHGDMDRLVGVHNAHHMARIIPNSSLHIVKNMGHTPGIAETATLYTFVVKFARMHDAPSKTSSSKKLRRSKRVDREE